MIRAVDSYNAVVAKVILVDILKIDAKALCSLIFCFLAVIPAYLGWIAFSSVRAQS